MRIGLFIKQIIDELRKVNAQVRGLSIEPLWTRLPRRKLCLHGIDWVILGGESGGGDIVTPFRVEWAEEVMEHCRDQGVAFFLKQLGRRPTWKDCDIELKDKHGGNFDEWEPHLRVREMPSYFSEYRN